MSGRVRWDPPAPGTEGTSPPGSASNSPVKSSLATDLHLVTRDLPIDDSLLQALPPDRRTWVKKVGMLGKIDIDGDIRQTWIDPKPAVGDDRTPVDFDFAMTLHDGSLHREGEPIVASEMLAKLHLTPDHLDILDLHARRGKAEIVASGNVELTGERPKLAIAASAKELLLDRDLYALMPADAGRMWDELQPEGTLDATIAYAGLAGDAKSLAATQPDAATSGTIAPIVRCPATAEAIRAATHDGQRFSHASAGLGTAGHADHRGVPRHLQAAEPGRHPPDLALSA